MSGTNLASYAPDSGLSLSDIPPPVSAFQRARYSGTGSQSTVLTRTSTSWYSPDSTP